MVKYPPAIAFRLRAHSGLDEATSTNAPETGVPATVVRCPKTCPYTDCAVSGRATKKNVNSNKNKTVRTSRAALILPLIHLLPGSAR